MLEKKPRLCSSYLVYKSGQIETSDNNELFPPEQAARDNEILLLGLIAKEPPFP